MMANCSRKSAAFMHGPSCLMATPLPRLNEGATPARALTSHLSQAPGTTLPDINKDRWDREISPAQRGRVNRCRARNSARYRGDLRGSGEHLVFLNAEGNLAALFLMEIIQSWNVLPAA